MVERLFGERVVHDGHDVKRHERGVQQSADARYGERLDERRCLALAERHDDKTEDGRDARHQNRAQTGDGGVRNGLAPVHAADAQLVDVVHEHDAVIHDDADEHDHAEHREQVDLQPRNEQREEAAGERERDREHDDERRFEILELRDHHEIYEQDTDREHQNELSERLDDGFALAGEADGRAVRGRERCERFLGGVRHERDVVALGDVGGHVDVPALVETADARKALGLLDRGNVPERDGMHRAVLRRHVKRERADVFGRDLVLPGGLYADGIGVAAVRKLNEIGRAGERLCHLHIHLRHGELLLCRLFLVHGEVQLGGGLLFPGGDVFRAVHAAQHIGHGVGGLAQIVEIVGVYAHRDAAAREHLRHGGHERVRVGVHGGLHIGAFLVDLFRHAARLISALEQDIERNVALGGHHGKAGAGAVADGAADGLHARHGEHSRRRLVRRGGRVGKGTALRHRERYHHLLHLHIGEKREALGDHRRAACDEQRHRGEERDGLVVHRPEDGFFVFRHEARERRFALGPGGREQLARERRDERERYDETGDERVAEREHHIGEELARKALDERDRDKDADGRERGGRDCAADLPRAGHGGLDR